MTSSKLSAQSRDTMSSVERWIQDGQFEKAIELLEVYQDVHRDFESLRKLGEVYYWEQQFDKARSCYERALDLYPEEYRSHMELSRVLLAEGDIPTAKYNLEQFIEHTSEYAEAFYLLGLVLFWEGDYQEAKTQLLKCRGLSADNEDAKKLLETIQAILAPILEVNGLYTMDDQPLKSLGSSLRYLQYHNSFISPEINVSWQKFDQNESSKEVSLVNLRNSFSWTEAKARFDLGVGALIKEGGVYNGVTWLVQVERDLPKNMTLTAAAEYLPYFWTSSSLRDQYLFHEYRADLKRTDESKTQFSLGYSHKSLPGDLKIDNFYSWLVSPPLSLGLFRFWFGYAYSWSDSNADMFVASKSIEDIIKTFDVDETIQGIYDPFFTPQENQIHSLIGKIGIGKSRKWRFRIDGSYGVYAKTMNPYLALDIEQNEYVLLKDFEEELYDPLRLSANFEYWITERFRFMGDFSHAQTFFYEVREVSLTLSYSLL